MLRITLLLCYIFHANAFQDFTGHKLYQILPASIKDIDLIDKLKGLAELDLWTYPASLQQGVNIRTPPHYTGNLEEQLKNLGLQFKVVVDDIQKYINKERLENPYEKAESFQGDINTSIYHSFEYISAYLDSLPKKYPDLASVQIYGYSHEKNPIKGVKIGKAGSNKPALWIDANIHAREWISGATALYIIDTLLKGYNNDPEITRLVDTFDWYILPIVNVDGYIYTWKEDRMWRKNRIPPTQRHDEPICWGADPNRNFNIGFGRNGTSDDMCTGIYTGPHPFSEAESQAIRDGVLGIGNRLKAYFSFHSFSQMWMTPYGYTWTTPEHFVDQMKALDKASVAIANVHGQWYKHGTIVKTIYAASGASADWAYEGAKIKYSFAIELRDTGEYGFLLPNNLIIPTGEETFAGVKAIAEIVEKEIAAGMR